MARTTLIEGSHFALGRSQMPESSYAGEARRHQCVIAYARTLMPTMYDFVENVSKYQSP